MVNLAIVIGSSEYQDTRDNLPTVKNDFRLISNIVQLSKKYNEVLEILDNKNSSEIKSLISKFINKHKESEVNEIFFYFSGHGIRKPNQDGDELFLKLYNTSEDRLSSSSLSNSEVDGYLRECNPSLAVKILDCCNSGTHYLKDSANTLTKHFESTKSKFQDLIFLSSSRHNEQSHAFEDYSFFTKALALSILQNQVGTEIYYKDLISSINDYSASTYYPEPRVVLQGAFLHPFITYNNEISEFLKENEKLKSFNIFEIAEKNLEEETQEEVFGLLALKSSIIEKSKNFLSKEEILKYVKEVQDIIENGADYKDLSEFFDVTINNEIYLKNEESIGSWLIENQHKDYFAEPRYEQESYKTQEYRPAPKKVKKVKKPSNLSNNIFPAASFLGRWATEYNEYEEVEQILETVVNYRDVLKGFRCTCSLDVDADNKVKEKFLLSLRPKKEFLCLRAYDIHMVMLFSAQEIATFIQINTLKNYDWDRYEKVKSTKWFVKENYFKSLTSQDYASNVIDSVRKKIDESIKDQLVNVKETSDVN